MSAAPRFAVPELVAATPCPHRAVLGSASTRARWDDCGCGRPAPATPPGSLVAAVAAPGPTLLLAAGETVAARSAEVPVQWRTLGAGEYVVRTGPPIQDPAWSELPPGTLLLLDPCGPTLWRTEP